MSQGLVGVVLAYGDVGSPEGCKLSKDHVVILDDGQTYSGADGCLVWLDGKGYLITELLDFYLASVVVEAADPEDGEQYFEDPCPCGSHYHQPHDCPVDDWQ